MQHLDSGAAWGESGYHGWLYGYGLHLTCILHSFPKLVHVAAANVADSTVLEIKTLALWDCHLEVVVGGNGYFHARCVRTWAENGFILLTSAKQWTVGRYAQAYQRFCQQPQPAQWLRALGTAV